MIVTRIATAFGVSAAAGGATWAQDLGDLPVLGRPEPGGVHFQPAATELARDIHWLNDGILLPILVLIVLFVTALLAYVIYKFNAKANPEPAQFTHNTRVEVAWTLGPILILIVIGSFSLPILFKQLEIPEPDVTIKAVGFKWAWEYEYPDHGISFGSYMLGLNASEMNDEVRAELAEYGYSEEDWKLATDTAVVVPVGQVIKIQTTASDVIHSWKIPAFGVHMDAIPGRLNETWFLVEQEGIYFGQCSELCGMNHAYMPIVVKAVSPEVYEGWVAEQVAAMGDAPVQTAAAE